MWIADVVDILGYGGSCDDVVDCLGDNVVWDPLDPVLQGYWTYSTEGE